MQMSVVRAPFGSPCCVFEQGIHVLTPKSNGNTQEAVASSQHDRKDFNRDVKHQTNHTKHNEDKMLMLMYRKMNVSYRWLVSSQYMYRLQSYGENPITSASPPVVASLILCLL